MLSPDEDSVLISNLSDGADIYSVGKSLPCLRLKCGVPPEVTKNVPLQVNFVDGGRYASCGSAEGSISIWDVKEGRRVQVLDHQGKGSCSGSLFNRPHKFPS